MNKILLGAVTLLAICSFATAGLCDTNGGKINAKKEFEEHCAVCHPNGGNTINAKKTLSKKSLEASGIKSAKDIISQIRNSRTVYHLTTADIVDLKSSGASDRVIGSGLEGPSPTLGTGFNRKAVVCPAGFTP